MLRAGPVQPPVDHGPSTVGRLWFARRSSEGHGARSPPPTLPWARPVRRNPAHACCRHRRCRLIGSHLGERLLADGWQVTGVDAFTPYYEREAKEANLRGLVGRPGFRFVEGDVAAVDLAELLRSRPVVFHLAAQPGVRASFGEGFADYVHHNLTATQRLLEAALLQANCRRVVMASSSSVYGDAESYPTIEGVTPTRPRSPYGATKRALEGPGRHLHELRSVDLVAALLHRVRAASATRHGDAPPVRSSRHRRTAVHAERRRRSSRATSPTSLDAVDATVRAGTVADRCRPS